MTAAPPGLLAAHAIHGDSAPLWLPPRVACRIVMHPLLGLPIGPFAFGVAALGDLFGQQDIGYAGTGPGWRTGGAIDGVAWLTLNTSPAGDPMGMVLLSGSIPDGVEIAVVRGPDDSGPGIATRRAGPYVLSAPRVRYLRISGKCQLDPTVQVAPVSREYVQGLVPLGLPLGRIADDPQFPQYLGVDDGEAAAWQRVTDGAPAAFAPHERPDAPGALGRPTPTPSDEVDRVEALVDGWVRDTLLERVRLAVRERQLPVALPALTAQPKLPTSSTGDIDAFNALLVTASDPGIARWLGLAAVADGAVKGNHYAVTVAGRWALPPDRFASLAALFGDTASVSSMLEAATLVDQIDPALFPADHVLVDLWTQAIIDPSAPPDGPRPPVIEDGAPAFWTTSGASDAARVALSISGAVPLGQLGLQRIADNGDSVPIMPEIVGAPGRRRPLFGTDGTSVTDLIVDPGPGPIDYQVWQADLFGRWSDSGDASLPSIERPALPEPVPTVQVLPVTTVPDPSLPFSASIRVTVTVPPRLPGQPAIVSVAAGVSGQDLVENVIGPGEVVLDPLPGPATLPATQVTGIVTVTFAGADGSISSKATTLLFTDPRPPVAPPVPPILRFTERPDAAGVAAVRIELPLAAQVQSWQVYMTSEARLRRAGVAGPDQSLGRDERASGWMSVAAQLGHELFDCLTNPPVPPSASPFRTTIPGDLSEIVFYRLVPQGPGGGSPPFATCPTIPVAVPFSVSPGRPVLTIDRSVEPSVVTVEARPGGVAVSAFRVRMTTATGDDVRAALIIAEGPLGADGKGHVTLPSLRPFARVVLVGEVRGSDERGAPPAPGTWSPPSASLDLIIVPKEPPQLITSAVGTETAGTLQVALTTEGLPDHPVPGPFTIRLYRRPTGASIPSFVEDFAITQAPTAPAAAGSKWFVALVDPIGRCGPLLEVT